MAESADILVDFCLC